MRISTDIEPDDTYSVGALGALQVPVDKPPRRVVVVRVDRLLLWGLRVRTGWSFSQV